jgi:hypothetical protein
LHASARKREAVFFAHIRFLADRLKREGIKYVYKKEKKNVKHYIILAGEWISKICRRQSHGNKHDFLKTGRGALSRSRNASPTQSRMQGTIREYNSPFTVIRGAEAKSSNTGKTNMFNSNERYRGINSF